MGIEQEGIIDNNDGTYQILSSKGNKWYIIDAINRNCECKGFGYRGTCRHLTRCVELWLSKKLIPKETMDELREKERMSMVDFLEKYDQELLDKLLANKEAFIIKGDVVML